MSNPAPAEAATTRCYLCSRERAFSEMHAVASPSIGPCVDVALIGDWFCADCFSRFKNSDHLRERVYAKHDRIQREIAETVSQTPPAALRAMEPLPQGLRITPKDKLRLERTGQQLNDVHQLQDPGLQRVVLNVYRNQMQKPYFNPETQTLKDYDTLVRDFRALEDSQP